MTVSALMLTHQAETWKWRRQKKKNAAKNKELHKQPKSLSSESFTTCQTCATRTTHVLLFETQLIKDFRHERAQNPSERAVRWIREISLEKSRANLMKSRRVVKPNLSGAILLRYARQSCRPKAHSYANFIQLFPGSLFEGCFACRGCQIESGSSTAKVTERQ